MRRRGVSSTRAEASGAFPAQKVSQLSSARATAGDAAGAGEAAGAVDAGSTAAALRGAAGRLAGLGVDIDIDIGEGALTDT